MANNFVRLAYAVVGEKYDTSKMSWNEVLEKFNEMNGTDKKEAIGTETKDLNHNNFKDKQELIDFIKQQTNVEIKNDPTERWNDNERILYARIPGKAGYQYKAENPVLSLLDKYGIRYEEHLNNGYWIYLDNDKNN